MTAPSIVVLTEEALSEADTGRLVHLHADQEIRYLVLVPADVERNLLADVLDHLSLLQLREALEAVRGEEEPTRAEAATALQQSLAAFAAVGVQATGSVVEGEPVIALQKAISADPNPQEVIVVTRPHAVEDTFHTDWASRARDLIGLPVLHVYAGSSFLG